MLDNPHHAASLNVPSMGIPLFDVGPLHFVGIGGIGMSGIAEILHNLGHCVRGSDIADNAHIARLRRLGIEVRIGHDSTAVDGAGVIIYSSAISADNPEIVAARARSLPVIARAEMLAEIMRLKWSIAVSGTHGKTTTTSLIAELLKGAGFDPTIINGGIFNAQGTSARLGQGDWVVAEADESDGSFDRLPSTIALVTNIDIEHMDYYGSISRLESAFTDFVNRIPFYGKALLCIDHERVRNLITKLQGRSILTYGFSPDAMVQIVNVRQEPDTILFDVHLSKGWPLETRSHILADIALPMIGRHNAQNAGGAIAVAKILNIDDDIIRKVFAHFNGINRRFTILDDIAGLKIVDDYGHHPVEIAAVLAAAREISQGRVIAVVQPHRYSRLKCLFTDFVNCFNDSDQILVAPIYAAGEEPIPGIDHEALAVALRAHGHEKVVTVRGPEDVLGVLDKDAQPGDWIIHLGAGSITHWAHHLAQSLRMRMPSSVSEWPS